MVLGAAEGLAPLAVARGCLVDVTRNRRRTDERDRDDVWMLQECVDRDLVAVDDVEDAVRYARFLQQVGREHRCGRVLLRWFQHERIAARDRGRPHPHWHHRGKVKGRDPAHDAERLANRVHVDPRRGLLGVPALEQLGDAAAKLDHLEPAGDLTLGVAEDLAVLGRKDPSDVVFVLEDELADPEEDRRLARERHCAPRGERGLRRLDRTVDLLGAGEIDRTGLLPACRVVDRAGTPRIAGDASSADPVIDAYHIGLLLGRRCRELRHLILLA